MVLQSYALYPGGNKVRIWRGRRDYVGKVRHGDITPEAGHAESVKATREMKKAKPSEGGQRVHFCARSPGISGL